MQTGKRATGETELRRRRGNMEKAEIERLIDEIVAHEAFEFNRRLKPLGISVEIRMVGHTATGDRVTEPERVRVTE